MIRPLISAKKLSARLTLALISTTCLIPVASAVDITDGQTTPVNTSTIDNGQPGDIVITSDGSITGTDIDGFVAVTVDSDNSVTNEGTITITDADNVVGIEIDPGFTGDIVNSGVISIVENYTRPDTDEDGDLDGPFAIGTGRYGILLNAGGAHTGNLTTNTGSVIAIEGNDSSAISLQSVLNGDLTIDGSITVLGSNSTGIQTLETINGNVLISNSVGVQGENAIGIDLQGDVNGSFILDNSVSTTGFESATVTNYIPPAAVTDDTPAVGDRLDADALLDNTAAISIGGSIANGILINGAVDDFISQEDLDDETKDTVEDFDENRSTGSITSYGSGPALLISADADGAADGDLVVGLVTEIVRDTLDDNENDDVTETLATFDFDYGLINRGNISAFGQNIGFAATGVRIEGEQAGTANTIIQGGFQNTGSIRAVSYEADATAISIGEGSILSRLDNSGSITATGNTQIGSDVTAILIDAGADLSSITNSGTIQASSVGETANTYAIRDLSGSLTSFTNHGTIAVNRASDGTDVTTPGDLVALDFSASTSGVNFTQAYATPVDDVNGDDVIDENDVADPLITGDILFGTGNDSLTLTAGTITGDIDFGSGNDFAGFTDGEITGNVSFAGGAQSFALANSVLTGNLLFTDSTGSISFSDGSTFEGLLLTVNSTPDLSIIGSSAVFLAGTEATLNSFTASGDSVITFQIDPSNPVSSILTVDGATTIGEGVSIAPILTSLPGALSTHTLITSGSLTFDGTLSSVDLQNLPWLYTSELVLTDGTLDTLDLTFTRKNAEQLGLDANQAAAFDSLIEIFESQASLGSEVATISSESEFNQFYDLLLPQRTDASTTFIAAGYSAMVQALDDSLYLLDQAGARQTRIWVQEFFVNVDEDTSVTNPGYNGDGLGFAFGLDRTMGPLDAVGLFGGFSSGDFEEKTGGNNPVTTTSVYGGLYLTERMGQVDLRVAGTLSRMSFVSHREIDTPNGVSYDTQGDWNGWAAGVNASADTEFNLGPIFIHPQVAIDYLTLSQDAYTETGGRGVFNASVGEVDTDRLSASTIIGIGTDFDIAGGTLRAELEGGYRAHLSGTPLSTDVSYAGSTNAFTLTADDTASDAALVGVSVTGGNERTLINFGYNIEVSDTGTASYTGATVRFQF